MVCTQLNHLHDDVFNLIVEYGNVEDVVSKERISKRFQNSVSRRLSKMRKIITDTDFFKCNNRHDQQVLDVLRKMQNLVDGKEFRDWNVEMVKKLASFNQSIAKWGSYESSHQLVYIEAVRKINPNYDAHQVMNEFEINFWGSIEDRVRTLYNKYPNLQMKFGAPFRYLHTLTDYERDRCIMLSIMRHDPFNHPFINNFNCSFVQRLRISYTKGMTRDMTIFANLKNLEMDVKAKLKLKEWKLPSKLENLEIYLHDKPWNPIDDDAMKFIIDNHSLTDLCVRTHNHDFNEMILNSPNTSLRNVTLSQFSVQNEEMEVSPPFMERDLIKRLFLRFNNVTTITMPSGYEDDIQCHEYFSMLKEVFKEIEQVQRNRSFRFVLIFD